MQSVSLSGAADNSKNFHFNHKNIFIRGALNAALFLKPLNRKKYRMKRIKGHQAAVC